MYTLKPTNFMVPLYFPDFCGSLCCLVTSEDLELGTTAEKVHASFVFLGLSYLIQYKIF